jgi:hypothetical protein
LELAVKISCDRVAVNVVSRFAQQTRAFAPGPWARAKKSTIDQAQGNQTLKSGIDPAV